MESLGFWGAMLLGVAGGLLGVAGGLLGVAGGLLGAAGGFALGPREVEPPMETSPISNAPYLSRL